jgi:flavodoxin I
MPFRYDESDPLLLIIYTGTEHDISDYQELYRRWATRLEQADRFGVIIVNEPHTHDDEDEEHHREEEAIYTKLINDFRRDHRSQSNAKTIGFANVFDLPTIQPYLDKEERGWAYWQEIAESRAHYIFGTRGLYFTELNEAIDWVRELAPLPPLDLSQETTQLTQAANRVGLFFGSTTGVTEKIAFDIQAAWAVTGMAEVKPLNIGYVKDAANLLNYDCLILGVPTWNIGQIQDDWEILLSQLDKLDFTGKRIALFGIGDQINYSENFQDALGILGIRLRERGALLVGFWSTEGYNFIASTGVEGDQFMGLAIDEVNQPKETPERIERWIRQIVQEFSLEPAQQAS